MKQHPVPQNIASYQFRLVGDMTLKQFLELASGVVTAYIIFYLHIPAIIKWPIMGIFALLGFALAFLPVQERPLDRWIINFARSIYKPTKFLWQKSNSAPDFLTSKPKFVPAARDTKVDDLKAQAKLKAYLETLPPQPIANTYDQQEALRLDQLKLLWQSPGAPVPQQKLTPQPKPVYQAVHLSAQPIPPSPAIPFSSPIPPSPPISSPAKPKVVVEAAPPLAPPMAVDTLFPVTQKKLKPEIIARFTSEVSFPTMPEAPNLITGMCLDPLSKILPNTMIEIIDARGNIVRALKTNKLGQFYTAGPLDNGDYTIKVENDQYKFDVIKLRAEGKIIPPLKIQARPEKTNFEY